MLVDWKIWQLKLIQVSVTVPYFSPGGDCSPVDNLSLDVSCLAGEEANISAVRPASTGAGVDDGPHDEASVCSLLGWGGGAAGMSGTKVDPHGGPLNSPDLNSARVALGSWDDLGPSGPNWIARVEGNLSFSSLVLVQSQTCQLCFDSYSLNYQSIYQPNILT